MKKQLAKWMSALMIAILLMTMPAAQMEEAGQAGIEAPVDEIALGLGDSATNVDGGAEANVVEKPVSEVAGTMDAVYAAVDEDTPGIAVKPNQKWGLKRNMEDRFVPEGGGVFVHCESSNPKVLQIKDDGSFKTLERGETRLTLQLENGEIWKVRVDVDLPNAIVPTEYMITMNKGDSRKLTYEFRPPWFEGKVTWSSSDKSIATVNASGKVTAKKAGTVTITVTSKVKKLSASLFLKVIDPDAKAGEGVAIDEKHFPDETFRDYIQFLFDTNNDGALSDAEIAKAVSLDINGRQIEKLHDIHSLKGLELLTAMKELELNRLELSKIDISKNTKLERLTLGAIQGIKTVDTNSNKALKVLCASDCDNLKSLNVSKNTQLTEIELHNNPVMKNVDVTKNARLTRIHIGDCNKVTALNTSKNPKLVTLECYGNAIAKLDVTKNPKLKVLAADTNGKIKTIDVSKCPELIVLQVDSNKIKKLDLSGCPKLVELVNTVPPEVKDWIEYEDDERMLCIDQGTKLIGAEYPVFKLIKNSNYTAKVGKPFRIELDGYNIKSCKSGKPKVASVTNGIVKPLKAGKTKITVVPESGKTLTITLTVKK